MNFKKLFISAFVAAFLVGLTAYVLSPNTKIKPQLKTVENHLEKKRNDFDALKIPESRQKFFAYEEIDDSQFKAKLLETGEGFHGDEILAKDGEVWFGLFNENNKFYLRKTKIKVKPDEDGLGEEPGVMTGKSVSINRKNQPMFLVKGAENLKSGEIKTALLGTYGDNYLSLSKGFKTFFYMGESYTLSVEGGENSLNLILETNEVKQEIFKLDMVGDATWNLIWVGDLDGDDKLDLVADLPTFYNFSQKRLFLSSQAKDGKLVEQVAVFHTSGC